MLLNGRIYKHRKSIHSTKNFHKYFISSLTDVHIVYAQIFEYIVCPWSCCCCWCCCCSLVECDYLTYLEIHVPLNIFVHFGVFMQIFMWMFSCNDQIKEQAMMMKMMMIELSNYFCLHKKLSTKLNWSSP